MGIGFALRSLAIAAVAALGLAFSAGEGRAWTVVHYSTPEAAYGWCTGSKYSKSGANNCARKYCRDAGGTQCKAVLECSDGWGAIAFPADPVDGVGIACNMANSFSARNLAMMSCMEQTNALCWIDVTFNRNGQTRPEKENLAYAMTWYAQGVFQIRRFDVDTSDGVMTAKTREAIKLLQKRLGRAETGELSDELFWRLMDVMEGDQNLIRIINRDVWSKRKDDARDHFYAEAVSPAPKLSFTAWMMAKTDEARRLSAATMLAGSGTPCTLPAESDAAIIPDDTAPIWSVGCKEGTYTILMSESSRVITKSK